MKILHISDIHYRKDYEPSEKGYKAVLYRMQSPLTPLGYCLSHALEEYPQVDCLLISGDLTEDGTAEDYAALRAFIEAQVGDLPVVVTLGNHDNKQAFYQGWLGLEASGAPYNCVTLVGDTAIVSWDTSRQGNPDGEITPAQMDWLRQTLDENKDKHVVLMTHHHFMEHQASVPSIPCGEDFPALLQQAQIDCLLCGHTHHKFAYFYGDVPYYGDVGVDTLGHISDSVEQLRIPNLQKLGLANLHPLRQVAAADAPLGRFCRLKEASRGKDTMTGHWEMMGLEVTKPFITFTEHGFPKELIDELERRTGRKVIGNKSASGTEILDELGEEEVREGHLIVYTSADSVLQICGNEQTMGAGQPVPLLRDRARADHARRMEGRPRDRAPVYRPEKRRIQAHGQPARLRAQAVRQDGAQRAQECGIRRDFGRQDLRHLRRRGADRVEQVQILGARHGADHRDRRTRFSGLCFVNLVDFDALWGHRRDPAGYAAELERFDEKLGALLPLLGQDDLLILTADHGNDPTYTGTDHTRETVPFVAYSPRYTAGGRLPDSDTFAVIGATIADNFGVAMPEGCIGTSILPLLAQPKY